MFSPDLESRILQEAHDQGLILKEPEDPEASAPVLSPDAHSMWGSRLASLVQARGLSPEALNSLAWDAIGGEAGSWVDPLFQNQPPLGDIPGLGARYQDLVLLGEGAAAKVFKAMDTLLQRPVALKVLKNEDDSSLVEARAQAKVEHPNVCRIYEVGRGHLVMQLIEGPTLARLAPTLGRDAKLRLVRDVALGVHAAHERGLVHLDLKLNNILIRQEEDGSLHPMVSDFGMVATAGTAAAGWCPMGTPPYTSPEQLAGDPSRLDGRADVYALGVMLYVLLAGVIPFPAHDFQGLLDAMATAAPVPLRQRIPRIPRDLAALVHRCMEKDPATRYPSAKALAEELDRFLGQAPVLVMGRGWAYRLGKWVRRNRRVAWVAGLALTALVIAGGVMLHRNAFIAEQAEWDHHFQKVVEEMRSQLDHAYRLPAHDIGPELQQARVTLKDLEDEAGRKGRAAEGPGYLAAGQARLLLDGGDPEALVHFQRAWDAGFRTEAARTWLALAVLDSFQNAQRKVWREPDLKAAEALRTQVREQYLIPARRMLQGRGNSEQSRVAHLLDLAEARSLGRRDPDRILQIARDYRARFPDDLEARIEEAQALLSKSFLLWRERSQGSSVWPPPCAAEVEPLREAAADLLLQAHRIAPSHPQVYVTLSRSCTQQIDYPTEETAPTHELLQQALGWLEEGVKVSRDDPDIVFTQAMVLGSQATEERLRRGLDTRPILQQLQVLLRRVRETGNGRLLRNLQIAILLFSERCGRYGILEASPLVGTLDQVQKQLEDGSAQKELREYFPFLSLRVTPYLTEAGLDPSPYLRTAGRFVDPGSRSYDWQQVLQLKLLLAEQAILVGGDAKPALAEAEACFQARPWEGRRLEFAELPLRLLQARVSPTTPAWNALEACLGRAEQLPRAEFPDAEEVTLMAEARLVLAGHLLETGKDARPLLQAARRGLETALDGKDAPPAHVLRELLARLCLLESRAAGKSMAPILEGLREADRALVYTQPLPPAEWRKRPRERPGGFWFGPPHQSRTLKVMGELFLALAEAAPQDGARRARQGLAAFQEAARRNRNLEPSLAPLRARAETLAGPAR